MIIKRLFGWLKKPVAAPPRTSNLPTTTMDPDTLKNIMEVSNGPLPEEKITNIELLKKAIKEYDPPDYDQD